MRAFNFRKKLYIGVVIAVAIVLFNALANDLSWYWLFKWLDNPMHVAGGFLAGYFGVFAYLANRHFHRDRKHRMEREKQAGGSTVSAIVTTDKFSIWIPILASFVVGVVWELLENHYGLSGLSAYFIFDTLKDLINDMIGGVLSYIVWNLCYMKLK
jgi:hypothetical protein